MSTSNYSERLSHERSHFNHLAQSSSADALRMAPDNIWRYRNPSERTPYPLEFAFHLLGDLPGKTVVELGSGDGLNTVILAALGSNVIAVDISDRSLELAAARARANGVEERIQFVNRDAANLALEDQSVDKALCAAILHHLDAVSAARELHRVLKPGGVAVFLEPMAGPPLWRTAKGFLPKDPANSPDEQPLTGEQVAEVTRLIGKEGRRREFCMSSRLACRMRIERKSVEHNLHRFDAFLLREIPVLRQFASPLVWEAIRV